MAREWQDVLTHGGTLVLDGGTGSELRRRGMHLDDAVWSALAPLTHYELLRSIHAEYIAAGADAITTNTFATTRFVLADAGHGDDFAAVNAGAVAAAREARDASGRDVLIAGSISCLPPGFDAETYPDENAECDAYLELAETLAEAGADVLLLEMMQETRHAPLACAAAGTVGLPVWLGVSCRAGRDGALVGFDFPLVPLAATLDALLPFSPDLVAVMHSPVTAIAPALGELRSLWHGPLGAYPEVADESSTAHASTPEQLAAEARGWIGSGARIVGGCCGTTPSHIRALAALRDGATKAAGSG